MNDITPCLWFDTEGEEAATFYGVVIDPVTFVVDEEATARQRAALDAPPGAVAASA